MMTIILILAGLLGFAIFLNLLISSIKSKKHDSSIHYLGTGILLPLLRTH